MSVPPSLAELIAAESGGDRFSGECDGGMSDRSGHRLSTALDTRLHKTNPGAVQE